MNRATNRSEVLRGLHVAGTLRWLKPGESAEGDMSADEYRAAQSADGVDVEGDEPSDDDKPTSEDIAKAQEVEIAHLMREKEAAFDEIDTLTKRVETAEADLASARQDADAAATERDALKATVAEQAAQIEALTAPASGKPDYERDGLASVDITKPATSKDALLVIAAYEGAEVADDATKADLIKAIEAKRRG